MLRHCLRNLTLINVRSSFQSHNTIVIIKETEPLLLFCRRSRVPYAGARGVSLPTYAEEIQQSKFMQNVVGQLYIRNVVIPSHQGSVTKQCASSRHGTLP